MTLDIRRIGTLAADLGECPLWDAARGRLWFMDCRHGRILRMDARATDPDPARAAAAEPELEVTVPAPAGSFAFNHDGRLVVALKEAFALVDPDTGAVEEIGRIDEHHPDLRLNDGTALADGSFLAGTMHVGRAAGVAPLGGLYRRFPDGRLVRVERGFGVTNGPRVSPADGRLHVCDSARQLILSYAFDADGGLVDGRTFADTAPLGSSPDGCCFDVDGGLWTALVRSGALVRFAPDGRLSRRIDLPLVHPTAPCFGGPAMDQLFVTSIRDSGRLKADGPLDGALLRVTGSGFSGLEPASCRLGGH